MLQLFHGVCLYFVCLDFIFAGLGAIHLVHWIAVYLVGFIGPLKDAGEDNVDLDNGSIGFAGGLHVEKQPSTEPPGTMPILQRKITISSRSFP